MLPPRRSSCSPQAVTQVEISATDTADEPVRAEQVSTLELKTNSAVAVGEVVHDGSVSPTDDTKHMNSTTFIAFCRTHVLENTAPATGDLTTHLQYLADKCGLHLCLCVLVCRIWCSLRSDSPTVDCHPTHKVSDVTSPTQMIIFQGDKRGGFELEPFTKKHLRPQVQPV